MNIVFIETDTLGQFLDLERFKELGDVTYYKYIPYDQLAEPLKDADIIVTNKAPMNAQTLALASHVKLVCVTATGVNILDTDYLDKRGIKWTNVAGYSTDSVAQHTFAMLFYLLEKLPYYDNYVKDGSYEKSPIFTHLAEPFEQLSSMTWGIIGLGAIGRRVADIAKQFGARVIYYSASGAAPQDGYTQVDFETLLSESDILSIHAPLNQYTQDLMNADVFKRMKSSAILINAARGPIVVEKDLADALKSGEIAAAGLDVLCKEPAAPDNPLLEIKDSKKLLITPHIAWSSDTARKILMDTVYDQIKDFIAGL